MELSSLLAQVRTRMRRQKAQASSARSAAAPEPATGPASGGGEEEQVQPEPRPTHPGLGTSSSSSGAASSEEFAKEVADRYVRWKLDCQATGQLGGAALPQKVTKVTPLGLLKSGALNGEPLLCKAVSAFGIQGCCLTCQSTRAGVGFAMHSRRGLPSALEGWSR